MPLPLLVYGPLGPAAQTHDLDPLIVVEAQEIGVSFRSATHTMRSVGLSGIMKKEPPFWALGVTDLAGLSGSGLFSFLSRRFAPRRRVRSWLVFPVVLAECRACGDELLQEILRAHLLDLARNEFPVALVLRQPCRDLLAWQALFFEKGAVFLHLRQRRLPFWEEVRNLCSEDRS